MQTVNQDDDDRVPLGASATLNSQFVLDAQLAEKIRRDNSWVEHGFFARPVPVPPPRPTALQRTATFVGQAIAWTLVVGAGMTLTILASKVVYAVVLWAWKV